MSVCQCENLTYLLGFDVLQYSQPFQTEDGFVKFVNFDFEPKYRTKRFLVFPGTLLPVGEDDGSNRDVIVKVRRERPAADDYWGFYFARSGLSRNVLARFDRVVDPDLDLDIEFVNEYEAKFSGYTQWNEFMMQFKDYNHRTLTTGEHIVVEPYLHGQFQNFDKHPDAIMDSLAHFSYHSSRGQYLIHGLRGVRLDSSYRLTVPLVHSKDRDFGPRDRGMGGIYNFFRNHSCTDICHGWSKPDLTDINMNTKDTSIPHRPEKVHYRDKMAAVLDKDRDTPDEEIYNSISDTEDDGGGRGKDSKGGVSGGQLQVPEHHYATVNKKPKDAAALEEIDLQENVEVTSENVSVYGGSQDTGYSSIRELKDFEKEPHCDDYMNSDPCVNDPDETSVIGLGRLALYNNDKYGANCDAGYVDIHQPPREPSREYVNEKTVTAIIHTEYRESEPPGGADSKDVYDTIESVGVRRGGQEELAVSDQSLGTLAVSDHGHRDRHNTVV